MTITDIEDEGSEHVITPTSCNGSKGQLFADVQSSAES